jgi:hypothetical protein
MALRPFSIAVLALAATTFVAAQPAVAKEGVEATLRGSIPLDAPAGTRIDVAWTLTYPDEQGTREPFGASGLFARLLSASGAEPETAFASGDRGTYRATVVVPEGGIGDVEFGLAGWQSGESGTRADAIFPITNDPLPGTARVWAPTQSDTGSPNWTWTWILLGGLILAALTVALVRRRPRARFS